VIIDSSHRRWCFATLLTLLVSTGSYVVYARSTPGGPRGGSVPGILYGVAGSTLMLYAGLISARKKVPTWRIGSAQTWLRGHIWLGLLSVPLILFHAGFRWGGLLEQMLLLVLAAIVVSGLIGVAVQQFLPGQMTARVPLETFYAQIPHECRLLQLEGDVAVAAVSGPLPVAHDDDVATPERLKGLGVKETKDAAQKPKQKDTEKTAVEKEREKLHRLLASVYRLSDEAEAPATAPKEPVVSEDPAVPQAARKAVVRATETAHVEPGAAQPAKPLPAANKAATVRAVKHQTPEPAEASTASPEERPTTATADPTKPKLNTAEKLAQMRAGNKVAMPKGEAQVAKTGDKATSVDAVDKPKDTPKAKRSAAEIIALQRAKKAAKPESVEEQMEGDRPLDAAAGPKPSPVASTESKPSPTGTDRQPGVAVNRQRCLEELSSFYCGHIRPFLGQASNANDVLANDVTANGVFASMSVLWPDDLRPVLDRLAELCEARRQLSVQRRIHHWLQGWLFFHVPLSLTLLGLGILHAVVSLYY
jgi:hypothetical protein